VAYETWYVVIDGDGPLYVYLYNNKKQKKQSMAAE
jgi:hypothetical protein